MSSSQTYCNRTHIVDLIGEAGVLTCIDDNANGQEDSEETVFVSNAINRAASEMNRCLRVQYHPLSALSGNEWCKWCNAYIATFFLQSRRGNSPAASVMENVIEYRRILEAIRWGRENVPEAAPTHSSQPAVSNFNIRHNNPDGPIVVDPYKSTGGNPVSGIGRVTDNNINFF